MSVLGQGCTQLSRLLLHCCGSRFDAVARFSPPPRWSRCWTLARRAAAGCAGSQGQHVDLQHQRPARRASPPRASFRFPALGQLVTRGTFYDVGYNTGLAFGPTIRAVYEDCEQQTVEFYETGAGQAFYDDSLRACEAAFPQYVRELRGLADGAGLAFQHVFMANVFERTLSDQSMSSKETSVASSTATSGQPRVSADAIGCTAIFLVDKNNHRFILHNEDAWSECKNGYLLTAEIEEEGFERESFTSFCYPGFLPNWAFGFNHHGLTFCVNAQIPKELVRQAPSVKFIMRSLVRARDVPDAIRLAKNAPHGVAYGFTLNLSTKDGQMTSVEVGPGQREGKVHVQQVAPPSGEAAVQAPCHYYHFNAYKHIGVAEMPDLFSSRHRQARTDCLPAPKDLGAALRVLADCEDPEAPIFRTPRPSDLLETVCSAVFDVTGRQLCLYQGRQDLLDNRPLLRLPLP